MSRGPHLIWRLISPGLLEIFGSTSMTAPAELTVVVAGEVVRNAERLDGKTDGRRGVIDVKVLGQY